MTLHNNIKSNLASRTGLIMLKIFIIYLHINPILSYSQVSITATAGTSSGSFSSLKDAFDAINAGTHQGSITIGINDNTSESLMATLNASGSGNASYTSIVISPSGGATRTISGNIAGPLINLNGADNVTINGLNSGGNSLTISNTNSSTTSGTSTIRFIDGASNNTIRNCSILGSTLSTTSGVILFNTSTVSGGNSNNLISNNLISNAGGNRPINTIYSSGTLSNENSNNTVSGCHIYNIMNLSVSSYAIHLTSHTTLWTISGNSFYETATLTTTNLTNEGFRAININNRSGNDFSITGNFIGGSQASCGGTAWTKNGNNNNFHGIWFEVGYTTASNIQGNTISNFSWTNSSRSNWHGIWVNYGSANIGTTSGNTIGSASGTGNITLTNVDNGGYFYGLRLVGSNINCQNNIIASITTTANSSSDVNFVGINQINSGNNTIISNNTIGSTTTANSIHANSPSTNNAQIVIGIQNSGTGNITVSNNTIANLTNGTTNTNISTLGYIRGVETTEGTNIITNNTIRDLKIGNANTNELNSASVIGICLSNTSTFVQEISKNNIYNLSNTQSNFGGSIIGLYFNGSNIMNSINANHIYGLSVNTNTTAAQLLGIRLNAGNLTCTNNLISLGGNTQSTIFGFYETAIGASINCRLYFNTVYISGNPSAGNLSSYCLWSNTNLNLRDFQNNIFSNARSNNGASGTHYALVLNYGTSTNLNLEYNNYYSSGTGGVLGRYKATNVNTLPIVSGNDLTSFQINPNFTNPTANTIGDFLPQANTLSGGTIQGITSDIQNNLRGTRPSFGAIQYNVVGRFEVISPSGPTSNETYSTLKNAFDAINAGSHTGSIDIKINASSVATTTATINASGIGSANYSSVSIYPNGGAARTIIGNLAAPIINLNGADNVTINGLNSGGNSLTISNINSSTTSGTSTIRFIDGASNNTIRNCSILGSTLSSTSGVILFNTSSVSGGNSNNLISNNLISNAGGNRPVNTIYSFGTIGNENSNNTVSGCHIYNIVNITINISVSSYGIHLNSHTTLWTISGNSFYETDTLTTGGIGDFRAIYINNLSGNEFSITGNFIGGSQAYCGGKAWTKIGNNNAFYGITISVGSTTASNIQGNTISNFSWTNFSTFNWSNTTSYTWYGIHTNSGLINIGTISGNTIGSASGTGNITYISGAYTGNLCAIMIETSSVNCQNNTIASITTTSIDFNNASNFCGIQNNVAGNVNTFRNNTIGSSTVANSIHANSTSTLYAQTVIGIYNTGQTNTTISNNTIANLNNGTTNTNPNTTGFINGIKSILGNILIENNLIHNLSISNANNTNLDLNSITGIMLSNTSTKTIKGNKIYELKNTFSNFSGHIYGIYFTGYTGSKNGAYNNFIHSLEAPNNTSTTAVNIYGIRNASAFSTVNEFANNIITLKSSKTSVIYGFYQDGNTNTNKFYFNTIVIGGAASAGSANSYALYENTSTLSQDYRNNILINDRTSSLGSHYAIRLGVNNSITTDNNVYKCGSGFLAQKNNIDYTTFTSWKTATTQDIFSRASDPLLANSIGLFATDYIPSANNLNGDPSVGITNDYAETNRLNYNIGAYEVPTYSVEVIASSGLSQADYLNLTNAFTAINNGTHTGQIKVIIKESHHLIQTAELKANGSGPASYSTIKIYPNASGILVTGLITSNLIDFNGASNIKIDGRVGGINSGASYALTLRNTSKNNGASTIRLINGASKDTVQFVTIQGCGIGSSGTIFFSTTASSSGNNNNLIQFNKISGIGNNRPQSVVFSLGTCALPNTDNRIIENDFFNFLPLDRDGYSIYLQSDNTNFTVIGNSFYETGLFTPSNNYGYSIFSTGALRNIGTIVRGNFIGGTQTKSGGSPFTKSNTMNNEFMGIYIFSTVAGNKVDSNIITNINWPNNTTSPSRFIGFNLTGSADFGLNNGNVIGGNTSSINVSGDFYGFNITAGSLNARVKNNIIRNVNLNATTNNKTLYGVYVVTGNQVDIDTNSIYNLYSTATNTTDAANIVGLYKSAVVGTLNIRGNTIGSTSTTNSLFASSTSTNSNQSVIGIQNLGTGTNTYQNNTIANLTNATSNTALGSISNGRGLVNGISSMGGVNIIENNTVRDLSIANANAFADHIASISGIVISGINSTTYRVNTVKGNTIFNLKNTFSNFTGHLYGIYFSGATGTNNGVYKNFIHSIDVPNNLSTIGANIYGIRLNSNGITTVANNIVRLSAAQTAVLHGLYDNGNNSTTSNFYHNTISIGGTTLLGSSPSYGFYSNASSATQDYRNNIFVNKRTGGTSSHYAIRLAGNIMPWLMNINWNNYFVGMTGKVGRIDTSNYTTLSEWQRGTQQDWVSLQRDPLLANNGGLSASDYIPADTNLNGIKTLGITDDYSNSTRQYFSQGAYDVYVNEVVVTVNSSAGTNTANYLNLTDAFAKINDGTHIGKIKVIIHKTHQLTQTALLNPNGVGLANYTNVKIYPSVANIVVTGSLATPLIKLDGASNIVFDGRIEAIATNAPYSLTFRNTSLSSIGTFNFVNGAFSDTLQYLQIEGSSTSNSTGTVFLGTSTTTGNSNNIIAFNKISNALNNRPFNSIYSAGSASPRINSGNIVMNNEIFNFLNPGNSSNGVHLEGFNTGWIIKGNSFYETRILSPSNAWIYSAINISNSTAIGTKIYGNFIGGTQPKTSGSVLTKTNTFPNLFYGIRVNAGLTTVTQVDSNIIRNINWNNSTGSNWYGIEVTGGTLDIGIIKGNEIGGTGTAINFSQSTATTISNIYGIAIAVSGIIRVRNNKINNINLTTSITGSNLFGIHSSSTNNQDIDSNTISNLTTSTSTGTLAANLCGIYKTGTIGTLNIRGNLVGNTSTVNSLLASSVSSSNIQSLFGIQSLGTGTVTITDNTLANLNNASTNITTTSTGLVHGISSSAGTNIIENNLIRNLSIANANNTALNLASVAGIMLTGNTTKTVQGNRIFNLQNTFTNFTGHLYGIYFTGNTGTNNGVNRNFIHTIETPNNTSTSFAYIYGIRQVPSGVATLANNIVVLKGSNTAVLHGLYDNGTIGTSNFYHNTIYIGGTAVAGSAPSYGLWSNAATATQDYRNNIIMNERTGGSGLNYGIYLNATTTLTTNYNVYHIGLGGITGRINTTDYSTINNWQTATSMEANSTNVNPSFVNNGSTTASDYIPQSKNPLFRGATISAVIADFSNINRTSYAMGAHEYQLAILWRGGNGSTPKAWNNASNWIPNGVPQGTDYLWIENNSNGHHPILDQNRTIKSIHFNGADKKIELGNNSITLTENASDVNANNFFQTNGTGLLIKNISNSESFQFPVGNANYNPVTIVNNNSASDVFSVKVRDEVLVNGTRGVQVSDPLVNVTWDISKTNTNSGSGVDFIFQWQSFQEANTISSYTLNHFNSTTPDWEIAAGTSDTTSGINTKTMTHYGYTGTFSPFAIGGTLTPLSIDIVNFDAIPYNKAVNLTWTTFSPNKNPFNILKSTDGITWTSIGKQTPTNNSVHYLFTDRNPAPVNYYQLSQLDHSNTLQYSVIKVVNFNNSNIVVFPNPNKGEFTIQSNHAVNFQIIDFTGKVIMEEENSVPLIKTSLKKGIYIIRIMNKFETFTQKLIIQ